jgi:peptide/nickel transport system permease protein
MATSFVRADNLSKHYPILGLGIPPPAATWGNILAEGNTRLFIAPWIANLAGLAIIVLVWGVNMLGNGLREHYDPRLAGR